MEEVGGALQLEVLSAGYKTQLSEPQSERGGGEERGHKRLRKMGNGC